MTKQEIRKEIIAARKSISEEEMYRISSDLVQNLIDHVDFDQFDEFLFYYPLRGELSLLALASQLMGLGYQAAFPRVHDGVVDFYQVKNLETDFEEGTFHVMEPLSQEKARLENTLVFTPGLAFDSHLDRLGFGKSYYDRFFRAHPGLTRVGICANRFFYPVIPTEDTDVRMHLVITETTIYDGGRKFDFLEK